MSGSSPVVTLSLSSPQSVVAGQVLNITATVAHDSGSKGVSWTLSGPGALTAQTTTSVTYTAPSPIASNGTATITATSLANTSKSASLTINLQAVSIALTPSAAQTDEQGQTTNVTAAVSNDPMTKGVTWSLNAGAKGSLSGQTATGVTYKAPASVTVASTDTITATSVFDNTKTATLMINLVPPPTVTTTVLPSGTVGTAYTTTNLSATGGVSPYSWTVTSAANTFPPGLALSSAGAISGTPTAYGTFNFTVQAKDANGFTASANLSIKINPAPVNITTASLPNGVVNTPYSATLMATGGAAPITWSWVAQSGSTLPPGLILAPTGNISGTPTITGTFNVTVTATDSSTPALTASKNFSITIGQAPAFSSSTSTTFTVGAAGTFTVTTTGFPAPSLSESGTLPSGVTFKDNGNGTGTLSGTPAAGTGKTYAITFTASNGVGSNATQNFTLTVDQAPSITSANSTALTVGAAGTFTVTATGFPTPSLTESGTLPSGVTFTDNGNGTGTLKGTPASGTNGSYPISFTASNGIGSPASQNFTLTVNTAPVITSANSTTFTVGAAGTFTVTTTGTPPPALTESGALPSGVTFKDNGNGTATLAGTPAAGTGKNYSITITASNGVGSNATQNFTLTVDQAPAITSPNSTTFTVGAAASFTVLTSGFPAPSLTETGALPSGVTFTDNGNGTGTLSGTPASGSLGTYNITFTATNGVGVPANQAFTLTVNTAPVITSGNNTTFTAGSPGTFSVTTTGSPTPTLTETGALPSGVTFTDNGNGTATLAGTPGAGSGGSYSITIKASSASGNTSQNFTLKVDQAPAITSSNSTTFNVGSNGSFTVTTTGFPAPSLTETGALPSGVSFNSSTNTLSGTPATGTAGNYPITFTASNGIGSNATQNFTLVVVLDPCAGAGTGGEALLNGQYAFLLKGFDNGATPEPVLVGGVLTLNGTGSITTGVLDMNTNSSGGVGSVGQAITGGTYKVDSTTHRACLSITTAAGTSHYRASLANITGGSASTGHMIDFDTSGPFTAGILKKQNPAAFGTGASQVSGNYAFGVASPQNSAICNLVGGVNVCGGGFGAVGVLNLSAGTVTGGELDFSNNGLIDGNPSNTNWPGSPVSISSGGTYTVSSTTGRGTLSFTPNVSGASAVGAIIYVVSSTEIFVLGSDDQTRNNLFAGETLQQSGEPFSLTPLSGAYVGYQAEVYVGGARTTLLLVNASGSNLSVNQLRNDTGSFQSKSFSGVTYSVTSQGRMTVSAGGNGPIFYLVSPNEAFVLNGNSGGAQSSVGTGLFQSQTSTSSPSGTYAFGNIDPEQANTGVSVGIAAFASPNINLTQDQNSNGSQAAGQTQIFTFSIDPTTGLGTIPSGCAILASSTTCQTVFYTVSPTQAVVMDATSNNPKLTLADK